MSARVVLVMHEPLGQAFAQCVAHVLGSEAPALDVFDVEPDAPPEALVDELAPRLRSRGEDEVLVVTDIAGATPFNVARQAVERARGEGARVSLVSGANLCMVLKALTTATAASAAGACECLSERVRLGAVRGIVDADELA